MIFLAFLTALLVGARHGTHAVYEQRLGRMAQGSPHRSGRAGGRDEVVACTRCRRGHPGGERSGVSRRGCPLSAPQLVFTIQLDGAAVRFDGCRWASDVVTVWRGAHQRNRQ